MFGPVVLWKRKQRGSIMRNIIVAVAIVMGLWGLCPMARGQEGTPGPARVFNRISGVFRPELEALGRRAQERGAETVVYAGEFARAGSRSVSARVTVQLPRMILLEGFKTEKIAFDGTVSKNAGTQADTALLESLLLDTQEGMLASIEGEGSARLLGRDFGPEPGQKSASSEARYDIYDVMMPDPFREGKSWVSRLYYFDSKTHLLEFTRYRDRTVSPPVEIETRFSMWGVIDGSAYPACIERYEDGKLVFSFVATGIESGPALDLSSYR